MMHGLRAGLLVCALLGAGACHPRPSPAISPGGTDAVVFAAVVQALRGDAEGVLLVDPRPLREGVDLTSVEPGELSSPSAERARVLERAGVAETEFLRDQRCIFAHGLPHPPEVAPPLSDSVAELRRGCRARPRFTAAVVGSPRRGDGDGEVVVAVVRMTTSRYAVDDFHLRRNAAGAWEVARVRRVLDVAS